MTKNHLFFILLLLHSSIQKTIIAQNQNAKPNIIILYADDLGWNDISANNPTMGNGSLNHQTPNIDKLAAEGMCFTHALMQQNCQPSRAAFLTGQYAPINGVYNVGSLARYGNGVTEENTRIIPPEQKNNVAPEAVTFAETLKKYGYKTYAFGKRHGWGGDINFNHGFDVDLTCGKKIPGVSESNYMAIQDADGNWIYANPLYNQFATPYTREYIEANLVPVSNDNNPYILEGTPKHFTDAITDVVINELNGTTADQPYCMWVCFHAIHSGIVARMDLKDKYDKRTTFDSRHSNAKYAGLTEQLDQSIGRIILELEKLNQTENTIIIFTSDNGGSRGVAHSNAPLRGVKGMFYEGGVRVPLIVKYPNVIQSGAISNEPVHAIDFYPTIAELCGAALPDTADHIISGESFAPILMGTNTRLKRDAIYWHFPGYMDVRQEPNTVIVKRFDYEWYKLRYSYETEKYELYNLTKDISETNNILFETNALEKAKEMRISMNNWLTKMEPVKMKYKDSGDIVGFPPEIKTYFTLDPKKTYYIDGPANNARLAADGISDL